MGLQRLSHLRRTYREGLLNDVVPFWSKNAVDSEFGGFLTCLDRQGRVIDTDKAIWLQGRMSWLYATLYSEVEPQQDWMLQARSGANFLREHGFDHDGRMFFHVTREGRPIRKRRYFFSECFTVMAYAALARADHDSDWAVRAREQGCLSHTISAK